MEESKRNIESLDQIKAIMERSTTFVSLSGLSGVFSGVIALIGVYILYISFGSLFLSEEIFQSLKNEQDLLNKLYVVFSSIFLPAIFVVISLINHQEYWLIIPMTLIFYGIALINAGKYSRKEILDLGIGCIFSGILSMYFLEFSFILWGIGFGVLNILTGIFMYYKYDQTK
jgi:hypothetical protein